MIAGLMKLQMVNNLSGKLPSGSSYTSFQDRTHYKINQSINPQLQGNIAPDLGYTCRRSSRRCLLCYTWIDSVLIAFFSDLAVSDRVIFELLWFIALILNDCYANKTPLNSFFFNFLLASSIVHMIFFCCCHILLEMRCACCRIDRVHNIIFI